MYRIEVIVEGVAPILFSRWTDTSGLETGATGGRFTVEERHAEALEKVYADEAGLYFPSWNVKKCLLLGAQRAGLKEGRASMVPYLEATCFVSGQNGYATPHFTDKHEPDFIHEVTGRRPPRTGGACLIKRPALREGWLLPLTLQVVDDRRSPDHLRRALDEAGLLVGLGSWRPEYGRFLVREWDVRREK